MNTSIIQEHLNNNQKVFVDLYEHHVLLQVTLDNIHLIKSVDISDEMLDDETYSTSDQESKRQYFSQDFNESYNTDVLSQSQIIRMNKHVDEMRQMLDEMNVVKIYHIDCEADVYIIE